VKIDAADAAMDRIVEAIRIVQRGGLFKGQQGDAQRRRQLIRRSQCCADGIVIAAIGRFVVGERNPGGSQLFTERGEEFVEALGLYQLVGQRTAKGGEGIGREVN
jgi:hypothetical protein